MKYFKEEYDKEIKDIFKRFDTLEEKIKKYREEIKQRELIFKKQEIADRILKSDQSLRNLKNQ